VVTERAELTDAEADVTGGLQFAARNVSRIGIKHDMQGLRDGVEFSVAIRNPYPEPLSGWAEWVVDASTFSVEPQEMSLGIMPDGTQEQSFTLKALKDSVSLQSLPRLAFNVSAGGRRHRFHREVRLLEEVATPYRRTAPVLDGRLADWEGVPTLKLGQDPKRGAEVRASYDATTLYLGLAVPTVKSDEEDELGSKDDLQIGMAWRLGETDFGADFLRLGLNCATQEVRNRTPARKADAPVAGVNNVCRVQDGRTSYEIAVPLRLLKGLKAGAERHLILDLSFPVPDDGAEGVEPRDPGINTFAYRVRYGYDSLAPVYFIELNLERRQE
jgi:hypothetical protein